MREEIEKFNKDNGNVTYTIKELISALHVKVDRIDSKLNSKLDKATFWKVLGGIIIIGGIIVSLMM